MKRVAAVGALLVGLLVGCVGEGARPAGSEAAKADSGCEFEVEIRGLVVSDGFLEDLGFEELERGKREPSQVALVRLDPWMLNVLLRSSGGTRIYSVSGRRVLLHDASSCELAIEGLGQIYESYFRVRGSATATSTAPRGDELKVALRVDTVPPLADGKPRHGITIQRIWQTRQFAAMQLGRAVVPGAGTPAKVVLADGDAVMVAGLQVTGKSEAETAPLLVLVKARRVMSESAKRTVDVSDDLKDALISQPSMTAEEWDRLEKHVEKMKQERSRQGEKGSP